MLVFLLGLLAVRLMDDEGEQTRCRGQDVTHVRLMGPLPEIQEGAALAQWHRGLARQHQHVQW